MHLLRPVQFLILLVTISIHFMSKSLDYSGNLLSCFDDMSAYDLSLQIQREYLPIQKKYLCEQERSAVALYNLCYGQIVPSEENSSAYSRFGHTLALLFRPSIMPPSDFIDLHNTQCKDFKSTVLILDVAHISN